MKTLFEIFWRHNKGFLPLEPFMDVFSINDRTKVVSLDRKLLERTCEQLRISTDYEYEIRVKERDTVLHPDASLRNW